MNHYIIQNKSINILYILKNVIIMYCEVNFYLLKY
jgi:hypothetical protein